jgi:hypothetical protein
MLLDDFTAVFAAAVIVPSIFIVNGPFVKSKLLVLASSITGFTPF